MDSNDILFLVLSYLLGSIPFGYIFFFLSEKKDIREVGSGNIGATNVLRNKGKIAGLTILLLDMLKGALPILYGLKFFDSTLLIVCGGAAAIIGHIFPLFLKFRGGKGVATFAGVFICYQFPSMFVFLLVFLLTVALTRYISLGSILGVISVFFFTLFDKPIDVSMVVFIIILLIIFRHRNNMKRLFAGSENRFNLRKT